MKIVAAGASGFLGAGLVASFRADGHHVVILTRRPKTGDDVAWHPGESTGAWQSAVDGADVLINLAGESLAAGRWTAARKVSIMASRIAATEALVAAIARARRPPAVFLSASAVGVYGAHGAEPLTEESSPASDFLASVCVAWEAAALKAASVTRVVLLRSGVVLDRTGGALPQLARPVKLFAGGPIGSGDQYLSWIHREDWTRLVRWASDTPGVTGPLNLTAPGPVTNREFVRTLARVLRRPAMAPPVPAFVLRALLGEMADAMVLTGQRVLPEKAARGGFTFRYPDLTTALRAIYGGP